MPTPLTLLFAGDIVGEPGRRAIARLIPELRSRYQVDLCIANGENAAGGAGITPKLFSEIREAGVDVVTSGDHIWDNKEVMSLLETEPCLLRAANYPPKAKGHGSVIVQTASGVKVGVLNLMGRTYMKQIDCPFQVAEAEITSLRKDCCTIFVDMHAEATSEKYAIGRFLDGSVSAVIGTHTHIQTADEQIFPKGTAFLCDAGMTGPHDSILGREVDPILERFISQMPQRFEVARNDVRLKGALIRVDATTGRALEIQRINEPL